VQLSLPVTLPLAGGLVALVDVDDAGRLSARRWRALRIRHTWYAVRDDGARLMYMHREIMQAPAGLLVDHRDGNGLNNTRGNLRLATETQNRINARPRQGCSSRFPGIDWSKSARAWRARVWVDGQERRVALLDEQLGVSTDTVLQRLGLDPDLEAEKRKVGGGQLEERFLRAFDRGE